MDLIMNIANTASFLYQSSLMQKVSIGVLDKALETESSQAQCLIESMPNNTILSGHIFDTYA